MLQPVVRVNLNAKQLMGQCVIIHIRILHKSSTMR